MEIAQQGAQHDVLALLRAGHAGAPVLIERGVGEIHARPAAVAVVRPVPEQGLGVGDGRAQQLDGELAVRGEIERDPVTRVVQVVRILRIVVQVRAIDLRGVVEVGTRDRGVACVRRCPGLRCLWPAGVVATLETVTCNLLDGAAEDGGEDGQKENRREEGDWRKHRRGARSKTGNVGLKPFHLALLSPCFFPRATQRNRFNRGKQTETSARDISYKKYMRCSYSTHTETVIKSLKRKEKAIGKFLSNSSSQSHHKQPTRRTSSHQQPKSPQ